MAYHDHDDAERFLHRLSAQIDASLTHLPHIAVDLARLVKIKEEQGESVDALIGVLALNGRKGQVGIIDDVVKELLDVAATALCAIPHFDPTVSVMDALEDHLNFLVSRWDREVSS